MKEVAESQLEVVDNELETMIARAMPKCQNLN